MAETHPTKKVLYERRFSASGEFYMQVKEAPTSVAVDISWVRAERQAELDIERSEVLRLREAYTYLDKANEGCAKALRKQGHENKQLRVNNRSFKDARDAYRQTVREQASQLFSRAQEVERAKADARKWKATSEDHGRALREAQERLRSLRLSYSGVNDGRAAQRVELQELRKNYDLLLQDIKELREGIERDKEPEPAAEEVVGGVTFAKESSGGEETTLDRTTSQLPQEEDPTVQLLLQLDALTSENSRRVEEYAALLKLSREQCQGLKDRAILLTEAKSLEYEAGQTAYAAQDELEEATQDFIERSKTLTQRVAKLQLRKTRKGAKKLQRTVQALHETNLDLLAKNTALENMLDKLGEQMDAAQDELRTESSEYEGDPRDVCVHCTHGGHAYPKYPTRHTDHATPSTQDSQDLIDSENTRNAEVAWCEECGLGGVHPCECED
ncbi:MAG: hypothetical protein JKY94_16660 [Rhodobacteraceae bacterium]|nr:hypothetical protein [Paracoccaceae bacterium]